MLRLDVATMETTPVTRPWPQVYPFDWIGPRHCYMSTETYQHLVDGDLEAHLRLVMVQNNLVGVKIEGTLQTARDLVFNLTCIRQRRAHNLAILASHLVGDGDHAIAFRVGECLGRMEAW